MYKLYLLFLDVDAFGNGNPPQSVVQGGGGNTSLLNIQSILEILFYLGILALLIMTMISIMKIADEFERFNDREEAKCKKNN